MMLHSFEDEAERDAGRAAVRLLRRMVADAQFKNSDDKDLAEKIIRVNDGKNDTKDYDDMARAR